MNILQYGKNPYFSEELEKMGHRVFSVGESETCDLPMFGIISAKKLFELCRSKGFVPDVFLHADDSTLPHVYGVEELPVPAVFYSIDTYCHGWHGAYSRSFDFVLYAQAEEKEKFLSYSEHFPLFAKYFSPFETKEEWLRNRTVPIAFVGTLGHKNNPDRAGFYSLFKAFMPIVVRQGNFVPVYQRARIVLNQSAAGEINFRTFEAMALGCGCLADNVPTEKNQADSLFSFGENSLPAYPRNDVAKAVDYAVHWLSAEKEQALYEIAMRGRELVMERHSVQARSRCLAELFERLAAQKVFEKRMQELPERRKQIARAFAFLGNNSDVAAELGSAYADIAKRYCNFVFS